MSEFASDVLNETYDQKNDLAIMTGDMNILRTKMAKVFEDRLLNSNPDFKDRIEGLSNEYQDSLICSLDKFLSKNDIKFKALNLIQDENYVTYGDCKKDMKTGQLIPLDTVLTHEIEFCSQQGLDYLFHI